MLQKFPECCVQNYDNFRETETYGPIKRISHVTAEEGRREQEEVSYVLSVQEAGRPAEAAEAWLRTTAVHFDTPSWGNGHG